MSYKRVLTIQDISCFGQCSLTVALPILSAAGLETVILPSAVLNAYGGLYRIHRPRSFRRYPGDRRALEVGAHKL